MTKKKNSKRGWYLLDVPFYREFYKLEKEHPMTAAERAYVLREAGIPPPQRKGYEKWRQDPLRDVPILDQLARSLGRHHHPAAAELLAKVASALEVDGESS